MKFKKIRDITFEMLVCKYFKQIKNGYECTLLGKRIMCKNNGECVKGIFSKIIDIYKEEK